MMFFLSTFFTESKSLDLMVSLLRGKNVAVKANKIVFPTKLSKKMLTFLRIV